MKGRELLIDESIKKPQLVGYLPKEALSALNIDKNENMPVYITPGAIKHIKNKRPNEFEKYSLTITEIIEDPDYVGYKKKANNQIEIIKKVNEYVLVGIKIKKQNTSITLNISSFYKVNWVKVDSRHRSGRLIKLN